MKPTINRLLKLLAWLLVIAIIVMLIIPSELTNEQLAQIKPGMKMSDVYNRIGIPNVREGWSVLSIGDPGSKEEATVAMWFQAERWFHPKIEAVIPVNYSITLSSMRRIRFWMAKSSMLWIEHDSDKVLNVWLIPVTKQGGGMVGSIDTLKQYWNDWWK